MTSEQFKSTIASLNLTQAGAARALGVNVRTIERYSAGKSPIPKTVSMALAYLEQNIEKVMPYQP